MNVGSWVATKRGSHIKNIYVQYTSKGILPIREMENNPYAIISVDH